MPKFYLTHFSLLSLPRSISLRLWFQSKKWVSLTGRGIVSLRTSESAWPMILAGMWLLAWCKYPFTNLPSSRLVEGQRQKSVKIERGIFPQNLYLLLICLILPIFVFNKKVKYLQIIFSSPARIALSRCRSVTRSISTDMCLVVTSDSGLTLSVLLSSWAIMKKRSYNTRTTGAFTAWAGTRINLILVGKWTRTAA